jgi:VanZ family protein
MKKKIIITISWLLVALWMGVIFMFSSQSSSASLGGSRKIVKEAINTTVETAHDVGIIEHKPSEKKVEQTTNALDFPFRKVMHMTEYTILCLLVLNALYQSGVRNKKLYIIGIIICFIYACTDEFHQSLIDRTPLFTDVLIDTLGAFIGFFIYRGGLYIYEKKNK